MPNTPCYMPKQIMTPEYASYSIEAKVLFSMIFTNAEHIKAIKETATLIEKIPERDLSLMQKTFKKEMTMEESEEDINV